ncbi:jg19883 [Pararge aegeria aegeria]|uniref:Jg19883 protein n=1 Tax=Pararge aegeria aegeria TaxID=348720 RepID=A0A8S4S9V2_9NEOP|nr:jg19883 [Pararge aegeria aegeria]
MVMSRGPYGTEGLALTGWIARKKTSKITPNPKRRRTARGCMADGVVFAMLSSERSWEAVVDFCEEVISQKEAAERKRVEAVNAHRLRRRRGGRRRREYAARLLALGGGG